MLNEALGTFRRLRARSWSQRRLFLSPRTVSSHLYRSFPKLGVADRYQLRDVIDRASGAGFKDDDGDPFGESRT